MHIVFGTALLIIAVLLIVGILSRRHWISTVLAVAIALIGVATIYTSTSIGPSSERQLYARAVLDNLSARLFGSDAPPDSQDGHLLISLFPPVCDVQSMFKIVGELSWYVAGIHNSSQKRLR